jgi:hypothetical protein
MDRPFVHENARERHRLQKLIGRLTEEELILPLGTDWTIAVALAHLAFWDQRALTLIRKWKTSGVEPAPYDIEVTNDSLLPQWRAIPPRTAAQLALTSARAIDQELAEAPPELIAAIDSLGEKYRLYRSEHRKMHLDQIEELLSKKRPELSVVFTFTYILQLENQKEIRFDIRLDKESLDLKDDVLETPPWATRKEFGCKNSRCTITDEEYCPIAQIIQKLIGSFNNILSTEIVRATVISEQRTFSNECAMQVAVSSLAGLYMPTCGCPVLGMLKPMVRYHLPFASLEETEFRVFSTFLLAQFLRVGKQLSPDFHFSELIALYKEIQTINRLAAAKIRELEKSDAIVNGLMILNAFAQMVSFDLEDKGLPHLEPYFQNWLKPA